MKYLLALFTISILFACGSSNSENEDLENNFHIEGKIIGAANSPVKIEAQSQTGVITVAETTTNSAGEYVIDGNIPGMGIYSMTVGSDERNALAITLEKNDRAVINASLQTFAIQPSISGTKWAKPLMTYMRLFNQFAQDQMDKTMKETDLDKQIELFETLRKPLVAFVSKQMTADPSNPVNIILSSVLMPTQETGLANWDPENLVVLKKMASAYQQQHADSPITNMLVDQIGMIEAQYTAFQQYESGELTAPEITLPNPQGQSLSLSNLKGKVVLIDFWASWCAPCRKENPNVVRMYQKYRSKGFEVFSVSLDQDPAAWKSAIKNDGLIWPNHVSDLMGWQTPLVQQYGFQSIPYTVLVNRDGKIVAIGLRGKQLEQKLVEQLSK
jgi:thiol-disulfide isomerase/thioredoxin